ncbi:MAG: hypothetical protein K2L02_04800, partial [Clostridia bacterium]|nr:hypothetical protein [Clostridia bacterium]
MDSCKTQKQPKSKRKKIVSWIVTGICILFLVLAVVLLILCFVAKKNESRSVEIFGYSFSVVETDSMTGEIEAGELITVKICGIEEAGVGANAVFIAESGQLKGRQVVHKVIKAAEDERGNYIVTQGVKAGAPIDDPVYSENFVGLAVRHSAFWGKVAKFFGTPVNWILILAIVIGIPVIYTLIRMIIKYGKELKKEKAEREAAEREKLKREILDEYHK